MLKAIQEQAGDDPVVITGDFNANMNELLGAEGPQLVARLNHPADSAGIPGARAGIH